MAIVCGIILAAGGLQAWMTVVAEHLLRRWAANNGLTILEHREARFRRGPFTRTAGRTDFVHRLTVRDRRGDVLEGWARVRGLHFGGQQAPVEAGWVDGNSS